MNIKKCNICNCRRFTETKKGRLLKCDNCGSNPRMRIFHMHIVRLELKNMKILHIAPEKCIYLNLSERAACEGFTYIIADIDLDRYKNFKNIKYIDLCNLDNLQSEEYDLILHSHVLEHTTCNIAYTLFHIHRILKNTGLHLCIIPFTKGKYEESLQDMDKQVRKKRFGNTSHVRRFGREDLGSHLGKIIKIPKEIDITLDFSAKELELHNIPKKYWTGFTTATVLKLKKNDFFTFKYL